MSAVFKLVAFALIGTLLLIPVGVLLVAVLGVPLIAAAAVVLIPALVGVAIVGLPLLLVFVAGIVVLALVGAAFGLFVGLLKLAFFLALPVLVIWMVVRWASGSVGRCGGRVRSSGSSGSSTSGSWPDEW